MSTSKLISQQAATHIDLSFPDGLNSRQGSTHIIMYIAKIWYACHSTSCSRQIAVITLARDISIPVPQQGANRALFGKTKRTRALVQVKYSLKTSISMNISSFLVQAIEKRAKRKYISVHHVQIEWIADVLNTKMLQQNPVYWSHAVDP